jgi:drug/metabolite transporter (DMT)-like permease
VLGEEISWQKVLAAVLIFGGVFLVNRKPLGTPALKGEAQAQALPNE